MRPVTVRRRTEHGVSVSLFQDLQALGVRLDIARQHKPSRAVSLLDRDTTFPALGLGDRHLQLDVHDIETEMEGLDACCDTRMRTIIDFVSSWDRSAPILIHCYAGISRSTATAYITACIHNPSADEALIAQKLREVSPTATPNRRFVALADTALTRRATARAAGCCASG